MPTDDAGPRGGATAGGTTGAMPGGAPGPVRHRVAVPAATFDEYRALRDATRARLIGGRPRRLLRALVAGLVAAAIYAAGVAVAFHAGAGARLGLWTDRYGLSWETDGFGVLLLRLALYLPPVLIIAAPQRGAPRPRASPAAPPAGPSRGRDPALSPRHASCRAASCSPPLRTPAPVRRHRGAAGGPMAFVAPHPRPRLRGSMPRDSTGLVGGAGS